MYMYTVRAYTNEAEHATRPEQSMQLGQMLRTGAVPQ